MSSVIKGTVHTHTGNVKSPTIVRYFPVSRSSTDDNKPDSRFRGKNGRLLRVLVYKDKSFVDQLIRRRVIIMNISRWSNAQLLAFNILYPNSMDSFSNNYKQQRI